MRHTRLALPLLALVLLTPPLLADGSASGSFQGRTKVFKIADGYAFWDRNSHDGKKIEVAVSNAEFVPEAFNAFYDPEPVIQHRFVDDETAVVYLQFSSAGKFRGVSYQITAGDGCAFCYDPETTSTVRLVNGRLSGKLSFNGEKRKFDITLDVPVPPENWGKPVAADGGELGKVLRAYDTAVDAGDRKAMFDLIDTPNQELWKKRESSGRLDQYIDYRTDKMHWNIKKVRIEGGFVRGDEGVLLVSGSSTLLDHIHGQVTFTRETGRWKLSEEEYQIGQ